MTQENWMLSKPVFEEYRGAHMDIFVHDTSNDDWQTWLTALSGWGYSLAFFVDSTPADTPSSRVEMRDIREYASPMLVVQVGNADLRTKFFEETEIEIDFFPNDVTETTFNGLCDFMRKCSDLLSKRVTMSVPSSRENAFLQKLPRVTRSRFP